MVLPVLSKIHPQGVLGQSGIELNGVRKLPESLKLRPEGQDRRGKLLIDASGIHDVGSTDIRKLFSSDFF